MRWLRSGANSATHESVPYQRDEHTHTRHRSVDFTMTEIADRRANVLYSIASTATASQARCCWSGPGEAMT